MDDNVVVHRRLFFYNEDITDHATTVALIIAGQEGIAPNVDFYSVQLEISNGLDGEIEWLIDNNVDIINMSAHSSLDCDDYGTYNSDSKYIDYIVREYKTVFVKSAGNEYCNMYVSPPASSANAIVVGATNIAGIQMASYSDYLTKSGVVPKPNLVAPGGAKDTEYINVPNSPYGTTGTGHGTSWAVPMVSGLVALMLDKTPMLMGNPELVTAILSAGATTNTNLTYDKAGAGLINAVNTFEILNKNYYTSYSASPSSPLYSFAHEKSVYLYSGQNIKVANAYLVNQNSSSSVDDFADLDTHLYLGASRVAGNYSMDNNVELINKSIDQSGNYTIKVIFYSNGDNPNTHIGAIAYFIN